MADAVRAPLEKNWPEAACAATTAGSSNTATSTKAAQNISRTALGTWTKSFPQHELLHTSEVISDLLYQTAA
jgi:hypothetical protein